MRRSRHPDRDYRIVELRLKHRWSFKRIAREVGLSVSRLEKILHDHKVRELEYLEDMELLELEAKKLASGRLQS